MSLRSLLLVLLGTVALGIAIERLVVTDVEAIEGLVADGETAFNERNFADLAPLLHPDFEFGGRDRAATLEYLERLARRFQAAGADVVLDEPQVSGDEAQASARVRLRVLNQFSELPVSLQFVRLEDGWVLRSASMGRLGP